MTSGALPRGSPTTLGALSAWDGSMPLEKDNESNSLMPLFQQCFSEQLHSLPACLTRVCPEEIDWFQRIEAINATMNEALYRQQCVLREAYNHFLSTLQDTHRHSPASQRAATTQTLRLHIYNTHHNQLTRNPELDTFSTTDLTAIPPPRWILRIQGRLLHPGATSLRMTSFFERILVSRKNETLIWERSSQVPQPLLKVPTKDLWAQHMAPICKIVNMNASKQRKSRIVPHQSDAGEQLPVSETRQEPKEETPNDVNAKLLRSSQCLNSLQDMSSKRKTSILLDASVSQLLTRQLVDCDGIELSRTGDSEEDIEIILTPTYSTPHYVFSAELASIVGSCVGTFSQAMKAIWTRARTCMEGGKNSLSIPELSALPCDDQLRKLFSLADSDTLNFYQLNTLLEPHLKPVAPITLKHRIRLTGDYIDNETVYDIQVDVPETTSTAVASPWVLGDKFFLEEDVGSDSSRKQDKSSNDEQLERSTPLDDEVGNILSELAATRQEVVKKQSAASPSSSNELVDKIAHVWDALLAAVARRNLLLQFEQNPQATMHSLLNSSHATENEAFETLLRNDFLEDYELNTTRGKFYDQPWSAAAVESYLQNRRKNLDELVGRAVTLSSVERREDAVQDTSATAQDSRRHESRAGFSSLSSDGAKAPTTRVPVFTQMSRHSPFPSNRYSHAQLQSLGRYVPPQGQQYNAYFHPYGSHLQALPHSYATLRDSSPLTLTHLGQPASSVYNLSDAQRAADWQKRAGVSSSIPHLQQNHQPPLPQQPQSIPLLYSNNMLASQQLSSSLQPGNLTPNPLFTAHPHGTT